MNLVNEKAKSNTSTPAADATKTHVAKDLAHGSPLISCRYDPTGRFLFVGAQDYRVWRFEVATGKKTELVGHESWVRGMAFHGDGQTLLTGGYDGRLIWWSATADRPTPIRTIEAQKGWVRAVAVSPDHSLVATVGNDLLVKLWKMTDGTLVREMSGHESHVYNVAFHPDGKHLVTGDLKCNLIRWDVATGKQVRKWTVGALYKYDKTFLADIGGFRGLTFSRDGRLLACSGITNVTNAFACVGNPAVVVFDWKTGKEKIQHLSKGNFRGVAWGVALHPQGFTIGAAGGPGGGALLFWKSDQKHEFHQLKMKDTARDLDMSPDGLHLATAHYDGHLRISKMAAKA